MRGTLYIFTFIFLVAMVSTLFQSSGLFEEDTAHAKTEISKKDTNKEGSDGSDEDAGDDAADSDYLTASQMFNWSGILTAVHSYTAHINCYDQVFQPKNTPPPKA